MAATRPLLDLTTLIQRETIRVDGVVYDLRNSSELTIFDLARLQRTADRVHQLDQIAEPTVDERDEYARLVEKAVRVILDAPEAVHTKLSTAQREAILWTFIGLSQPSLGLTRAPGTETAATAPTKTARRSARGSRASTVAPRKAG